MKFVDSLPPGSFTRLHAHIVEEDGAFTVRVRMLNHLNPNQSCWGEEIAATFDAATAASVASKAIQRRASYALNGRRSRL